MSDFDEALGYVQRVLSDLQSRGAHVAASATALRQLVQVAGVTPARPATVGSSVSERRTSTAAPVAATQSAPTTAQRRALLPSLPPAAPVPPRPATPLPPSLAPNTGTNAERLAAFRERVLACTKCEHLVRSCTNVVFGVGNPDAELMFVGEAPGEDEDLRGEPFVGKAGELLTKIITAMSFGRDDVYIANVLKCRPDMPAGASGNRKPTPEEMQVCLGYLKEQIEIIRPRALVALGATAVQGLLGNTEPVGRLRGQWLEFEGIPLMVTYHPAYLLRNQALGEKRKVWEDMLKVLELLGRPISDKQRAYFTRAA